MNINKDLAHKLVVESESFREYVINKLFSESSVIAKSILSFIRENHGNKLACIKYVRENFTKDELVNAFPHYNFKFYNSVFHNSVTLDLKSAKEFVEMEINDIDIKLNSFNS